MKNLAILFLTALLIFPTVGNAEISLLPKEVCNMIMVEKGFENGLYKPIYPGSEIHHCQSEPMNIGSGIIPNEIIYSSKGSEESLEEMRLNLTVYEQNSEAPAMAELESLGLYLVEKVTGEAATEEVKELLSDLEPKVVETENHSFEIEKDVWDTGEGYSVIFYIR